MKTLLLAGTLLFTALTTHAQDITLPHPVKDGGKPFLETVNARRSERTYVKKAMSKQILSNLLWTANGFNRPGKRTVASSRNKQEMELYVVFDHGVYFYNAYTHLLKQVATGDFRSALGQPEVTDHAALSIVMVADLNKSTLDNARIATGYISQNIYLFAASEGLGTVARGSFQVKSLSKALKLNDKQTITLVHPVGFLK